MNAEVEALRRWKAEALIVLAEWDRVYDALGRPGHLGQSKAAASLTAILGCECQPDDPCLCAHPKAPGRIVRANAVAVQQARVLGAKRFPLSIVSEPKRDESGER